MMGTVGKGSVDKPDESGAVAPLSSDLSALPPIHRFASRKKRGLRSQRVVGDIVSVMDFLLIVGAAAVAKWLYIGAYLGNLEQGEPYFALGAIAAIIAIAKSEGRRVGKEWVSKFSSWGGPDHKKK